MVGVSRSFPTRTGRGFHEPGPVGDEDDGAACEDCPDHAAKDAVYRVYDPRWVAAVTSPLCEYHLAVYRHENPRIWAELARREDHPRLEAAVRDQAFVELADLPEEFPVEGTLFQRLGLDEHGLGHFIAEAGSHYRLIHTDEQFDIKDGVSVPIGELHEYLDAVEEEVDWRAREYEWVDRAYDEADVNGGEAGGE